MGLNISGSANSYVLQMRQENQRHAQLNGELYENRKASQSNVVQSIQDESLKMASTTAAIKEGAVNIGSMINTFA